MLTRQALEAIWTEAGLPRATLDWLELTGADPILPSSFAVGAAAQASIAVSALAAALVWSHRGGQPQSVSVDMRHAAAEARSERYIWVEGQEPAKLWDRIAGAYQCGDGGWVRLHTNFRSHRDGVLRVLRCGHHRAAVARALDGWSAQAVEDALADAGLVGSRMRSFAEWDDHPQCAALASQPLVGIEKIGDAPPRAPASARRPLSGIRVLELTRVIAGPVCGRTLAAHGADVLHITAQHLPFMLVEDTGRGKLSTQLDLRKDADADALRGLLGQADIFVQGYRPGGVGALGFGPEAAAALRPGLIYVSLSAYGPRGPWSGRRGVRQLGADRDGLQRRRSGGRRVGGAEAVAGAGA